MPHDRLMKIFDIFAQLCIGRPCRIPASHKG